MKKEKSNIIVSSNIPLILTSYNDIFSSFDSRSFSEKALSDDFLIECKRAARDKADYGIELALAIPNSKRNSLDELKIKKRLIEHFHKHFLEKEKEMKKIRKEGIVWVILGALLIFGVGYGLVKLEGPVLQAIFTIFEVPGWFLVWEGMSKVFLDSRKIEPDYLFYKKMASADIIFTGY